MTRIGPSRRNYRNATGRYGRWSTLSSLGPVVYAMRLDDGVIKIGFTTNLADRERSVMRQSGSSTVELLGFQPGTLDDERAIHAALQACRAHGREYYRPAPPVIEAVNAMRGVLGLEPLPLESGVR